MKRTLFVITSGTVCAGMLGFGFMLGQSDVRRHTVVKMGAPFEGVFFGKCAKAEYQGGEFDLSGERVSRITACATDEPKKENTKW